MSPAQGAHNLRQRAEQLAAILPPLLVAAERVAATVVQGVHGRRRVGQGETFWQFRHYEVGDPPQIIDWRQSAKTDHIFTRQMEWEAAQSVWIWRDTSPSMDWRSDEALPTKRERADLLSLALAALLVRGGERVSLLGSSLRPASGRGALTRLANAIALGDPAGPALAAASRAPANGPAAGEDGGKDGGKTAFDAFFGQKLGPLSENSVREIVWATDRRVHRVPESVVGQTRKSVTATRKSAFGGKAEVDFEQLEVSL